MRQLLGFLALALLLPAVHAQALKLRILETTDIHMHLLDFDYFQDRPVTEHGLVRTASLINTARAEAKNTLLFDNGDLLQGGPMGDFVARGQPLKPGQVHPAFKMMNAMRYDAANLGNHEFNYGLPFLRQALAGAAFPYVNANLHLDDGRGQPGAHAFTPYVILDRSFTDDAGAPQALKIGVIGVVPPQVMRWDRQALLGQVVPRDMVDTVRRLVPEIKARGADLVVLIAHTGFDMGETVFFAENAIARLAEVAGIDALLFGHSHREFPGAFFSQHPKVDLQRGTINGIPATMPGFWGSHLGVIDLELEKSGSGWKVIDGRAQLRPIWDHATRQPLVEADTELAKQVQAEHEGTRAYMRQAVAQTRAPIQTYFARVADNPSVELVSQAQRAYARRALAGTAHAGLPLLSAAAPFRTGGLSGAYTDIPAGPILRRHAADLYVFPNTVAAVVLTGAQVREWLEMSAIAFRHIDPSGPAEQEVLDSRVPSFNFDTLDGVSYRIDLTQPARYERSGKLAAPRARRIVDLRYQGEPIDLDARFVVVTNNHRASGGGNFPGLDGSSIVLAAPDENREVLTQYLAAAQTVDPSADGNWHVLPVPGVKLRFVSGAGGVAHLARYPGITLVRDNGDGTALFELQP